MEAWGQVAANINAAFPNVVRSSDDCEKRWYNIQSKSRQEISAFKRQLSGTEVRKLLSLKIYKHLETPKFYAGVRFIDFYSAFKTIQQHILLQNILSMNVNRNLILWIEQFLINQLQCVHVNQANSTTIYTNTGAPYGCVISPVLFILYTNDCVSRNPECLTVKFAYDAASVDLIKGTEATETTKGFCTLV